MKKVLMLVALFLGTSAMVNAQEPAKTAPAKEVKATKKAAHKAKVKAEKAAEAPKMDAKAKK